MDYSKTELEKHLEEEHGQTPFATYLQEIVYGGSDGIVTTFAVVAGFTGANSSDVTTISFIVVLIFGLANLLADALSMGLGNFLSIRSDQGVYQKARRKEAWQIANKPEYESQQTIHILQKRGFSETDAKKITELYKKNPEYWADFMMNYELEMPNPMGEKPFYNGVATFLSFLVFGFIPLAPYLIVSNIGSAFFLSCLATLMALILLGLLRWKVTHEPILRAVFEVVLLGGVSAVVAYLVGFLFSGHSG